MSQWFQYIFTASPSLPSDSTTLHPYNRVFPISVIALVSYISLLLVVNTQFIVAIIILKLSAQLRIIKYFKILSYFFSTGLSFFMQIWVSALKIILFLSEGFLFSIS